MFKRSVLFSGLALLATSAAAHAQNEVTSPISVTVQEVLAISATGSFTFDPADDADYTASYVESTSGPTLSHRGNVPYSITLSAQSGSELVYVGTETDPNKPISDLSILSDIGGTPVDVDVGPAGTPADFFDRAAAGGDLSSALTARLALDYANTPPGTYSTTVVFTMVAN